MRSSPFAESLLLLESLDHHVFEFVVLEHAVSIFVVIFHNALDTFVSHVVVLEHFFDLVDIDRPALVLVKLVEDASQLVLAQQNLDVQGSGNELGVVDKAVLILVNSFEQIFHFLLWQLLLVVAFKCALEFVSRKFAVSVRIH